MNKILLLCGLMLLSLTQTYAAESPTACTMQYAPVCGSVQVQCIRAPCYPVRQTFGNSCMAAAAAATDVTVGECEGTNTPPVVGGDSDSHGCRASAGYSWNNQLQECIQPWVTRTRIMTVLGNTVACVIFGPTRCLQIKDGKRIVLIDILNLEFTPVAGYTYRILVREDISNSDSYERWTDYSFIKILSKKPKSIENPLLGKWTLIQFNTTKVENPNYTLNFEQDRLSAKFCNNMFGSYTLSGNTIVAPAIASTMMYCEGQPMTLENAFSLDAASYSLVALRLMAGSTGPTMHFIITTKKGDTFTYGMR